MPKWNDPERKPTVELLTTREVAKRLRVHDSTVRQWIKDGALEAVSLPHSGKRQAYRVKKSIVDGLTQPKKAGQ